MECATGSLLPAQARAGKPPVAPKLYQYPKLDQSFIFGFVALLFSNS